MTDRRDPLPTDVTSLPPLPVEYTRTLEDGLTALGLDVPAGARIAVRLMAPFQARRRRT